VGSRGTETELVRDVSDRVLLAIRSGVRVRALFARYNVLLILFISNRMLDGLLYGVNTVLRVKAATKRIPLKIESQKKTDFLGIQSLSFTRNPMQ